MDYRKWFLDERGITSSTLDAWNVATDNGCIQFKYQDGIKVRRVDDVEGRTFSYTGTSSLYKLDESLKKTTFIVEGETDTLRLWQELKDQNMDWSISVVGISGLNGYKESYADEFKDVEHVIVVLDNDPGYRERDTADLTYRKIRDSIGRGKVRRIRLRDDVKDICEFFKSYTWESFKILTTPNKHTFYKPLDLTKDPEPFQWLVDNWLCQGDVALLVGEPNVGKSFISMALAIAVAEGKETFLGEKLLAHGKVLYIDEENPEDVVLHRLSCLGLTGTGMSNIHYYHRQHIRLDRGIDNLLDDALVIQPKLIVIDSLTRVHNQNEIDAGAMNLLFNEGIMPLARETGAAVLVLHHAGKTESNNSFNRTRGSSDLGAVVDTGIDVRSIVEPSLMGDIDALNLVNFKSRRRIKGNSIKIQIADTLTGEIELRRLNKGGSF